MYSSAIIQFYLINDIQLNVKKINLHDPQNEYRKLVKYCLERLKEKGIVRKETRVDQSDAGEYTIYCPNNLFEAVKPQIVDRKFAEIDKILEDHYGKTSLY